MKPGRVVALVIGCLLVLPGVGLLLGGGGLGIAAALQGEDGYIDTRLDVLRSDGVAVTAGGVVLVVEPDTPDWVLEGLSVDTRLVVTDADGERPMFAGIGSEADVNAYLEGVAHSETVRIDGRRPTLEERPGSAVIEPPTDQTFWAASVSGPGEQVLDWQVADGQWAVVVMNADGSPGIAADVEVGVNADFLAPLAVILVMIGLVLTVIAVILIIVGAHGAGPSEPSENDQTAGGATVPGMAPAAQPAAVGLVGVGGPGSHPVSLNAHLDHDLSRWLWLVKWFLAIPHFLVLGLLWVAFAVLTVVAGFSILFTGVYPRSIFDFNLGVLRWSWRVSYYAASGGLGTDRYPPFSLQDDPGYPARLDIAYPQRLSRGLVLVKWWLLAIPHYIIVGILVGGSLRWLSSDDSGLRFDVTGGGGVLGVLVFIAAVVLLFTGRYPQQLYDLIVGFNRWVYRVWAYAALMTDEYPPFRLDQGGSEPTPEPVLPPPPPPPSAVAPSSTPQSASR